jgi:hypothetical protein
VDPEVCAVGNARCLPPEWLPWPMGRSGARPSGGTVAGPTHARSGMRWPGRRLD